MMDMLRAFDATLELAAQRDMGGMEFFRDGLSLNHLRDMRSRIEPGFSSAKLGRWLGWAQCAVVAAGVATLDDMKAINKSHAGADTPPTPFPSKAAVDVLAERRRQIEAEGWTPEHDDQHRCREIPRAAISYAMSAASAFYTPNSAPPSWWPWDRKWWKPKDRRQDLVRAAALLIAEIERRDRFAATISEASR